MVLVCAAAILAAAFVSCRTTLSGTRLTPLRAASAAEALEQLHARAAAFSGARALMRVRITSGGRTDSFRAQLHVPDRRSMELIAYTPVGTAAATIRAAGDQVRFENHVDKTSWSGSPEDLARSLSIYSTDIAPAEMAMLLLGLPAVQRATYVPTAAGLASASASDVTVTFDPPHFPPKRVIVRRGAETVEIEHLEIVDAK